MMYGGYDASTGPKALVTTCNALAVAAAGWFLIGGTDTVADWFGTRLDQAEPLRRGILFTLSAIYLLRFVATTFVMLKRSMEWSEAATVGVWVVVIHGTMAYLGGTNTASVGALAWVGVVLYIAGSYLNTASEYRRKLWKRVPEHKGRLYTEGLFKYSMHINYFGDVVLFTGFALVTGSPWALAIPVIMACMFSFLNIPTLDKYLAERYGTAFEEYSRRTAKLVPFIY
ncbi:methyltransferase family protein [Streptomyces phaeochromogenes]|uniref:methyltransferase family protein n=1 Tax=Streptomyces phaeochromogenes TaxID=1923 RepID=UPI003723E980